MNLEKGSIFLHAKKAGFQPAPILQIFIFICLFIVGQIFVSIPVSAYILHETISSGKLTIDLALNNSSFLILLFSCLFSAIPVLLYCKFGEKRSMASMGFTKSKRGFYYISGLFSGALLFSVVILIAFCFGIITYDGSGITTAIGILVLFFLGYLIQGMYEEVLVRGYFMVSLANRTSLPVAILLSSFAFALLHISNPGITIVSFLNLVLFGILASVLMIKTDNIWLVGALHSSWNFVQGNIFGMEVSGIHLNLSVFHFSAADNRSSLLTGGTFGMEGSIITTLLFCICIIILLFIKPNCKETLHSDL